MSKWREEIFLNGDVRIIYADCRDVLPTLENVDALIWDPPWGIDFSEYNTHKDKSYEYKQWINETLALAEDNVRDGWCVVFQSPKRAHEWHSLIPRKFRVMACAKNFTQILPGSGPLWSTDFALFWPVGTPSVEHGRGRDYHVAITSNMRTRPKGHPCPRPIDQMKYIVECFTDQNMIVLDPTCGSGTTGVACVELGRKFIGIEIDPAYFDIACRRISESLKRPDLFIDRPKQMWQEEFIL